MRKIIVMMSVMILSQLAFTTPPVRRMSTQEYTLAIALGRLQTLEDTYGYYFYQIARQESVDLSALTREHLRKEGIMRRIGANDLIAAEHNLYQCILDLHRVYPLYPLKSIVTDNDLRRPILERFIELQEAYQAEFDRAKHLVSQRIVSGGDMSDSETTPRIPLNRPRVARPNVPRLNLGALQRPSSRRLDLYLDAIKTFPDPYMDAIERGAEVPVLAEIYSRRCTPDCYAIQIGETVLFNAALNLQLYKASNFGMAAIEMAESTYHEALLNLHKVYHEHGRNFLVI